MSDMYSPSSSTTNGKSPVQKSEESSSRIDIRGFRDMFNIRAPVLLVLSLLPFAVAHSEATNPSNYKLPAEFEKDHESVWFAWATYEPVLNGSLDPNVLEAMKAVAPHVYVDMIVDDAAAEAAVRPLVVAYLGAQLAKKVRYRHVPHLDFWIRDMGCIYTRDSKGRLACVHFKFNGWGFGALSPVFADAGVVGEAMGPIIAKHLGIPVLESWLRLEGGGIETNGKGTIIVSERVVLQKQRNPGVSKHDAEKELKRVLNVKKVIWVKGGVVSDDQAFLGPWEDFSFEVPAGRRRVGRRLHKKESQITDLGLQKKESPVIDSGLAWGVGTSGHTDEFVRFINENTVLLAEVTKKEAKKWGPTSAQAETRRRLEDTYKVLKAAKTAQSNKLKIIRVPMPEEYGYVTTPGDGIFDGVLAPLLRGDPGFEGKPVLEANAKSARVMAAASYLNYLVTNKVVLAPRFAQPGDSSSIRAKKDAKVKKILQDAFPGRKVLQFDVRLPNYNGGGIHCFTQQMPKGKTGWY